MTSTPHGSSHPGDRSGAETPDQFPTTTDPQQGSAQSPTDGQTASQHPPVYTGGRTPGGRPPRIGGVRRRSGKGATPSVEPRPGTRRHGADRDPASTPASVGKPRRKRALPLVALGAAACILAVFIGGFLTGWTVKDNVQARRTVAQAKVVEVPVLSGDADTRVPDVRGLSVADAKQALADLELDASTVHTTEVEWAGAPGLVIAQDPVVGETFAGKLSLTVSTQARVPDIAGKKRGEAVDALRALGTEPTVVEKFDAAAAAGSVLAVEPAVGSPLPGEVTLTVAQAGSSLYLSEVAEASSSDSNRTSCSTDDVSLDGTSHANALRCGTERNGEESTASWVLGRHADLFTATVGVSDSEDPGTTGMVRVLADGKEVARVAVSYGRTAPISAKVSGALRLDLVVSSPQGSDVHLAEALVRGTDAQIDALEAAG